VRDDPLEVDGRDDLSTSLALGARPSKEM